MTPLGLVENGALAAPLKRGTEQGIHLSIDDVLASASRMWVRGRLSGGSSVISEPGHSKRWWWRRRQASPNPAPKVHLEVRISGSVLTTELPLLPGGRFDAILPASLPRARRGWRVARHRASYRDSVAETCGLVLAPRPDVGSGVVVVLPMKWTGSPDAGQSLLRAQEAGRLTPVLKRLSRSQSRHCPFYYLATVPPTGVVEPAELALATTTLGWPAGSFVLLPGESNSAAATLLHGVDRLRSLFAGDMDLLVINLEPALARLLSARLEEATDRAPVRRLINPADDPWTLFEHSSSAKERGPSIASPLLRPGPVPRYPVVFCHGMLAYSMLRMQIPEERNCFTPLRKFLEERGCHVLLPEVAPTGGVSARAHQLREQILRWTDEPVNLIAHSMGGLDCRYLITQLHMADRVRSLTTIGTPHRGTYLAEWFLANYRNRVPLLLALEAIGVNFDGFRDCRRSVCAEFNVATPNAPGVRYFSYAGDVPQAKVTPVLRRAWSLLTAEEGPNDAMVSVASARWGEYLGTVCADHFAQTPDGMFVRDAEDFDSLGFCIRIVEDLARRGF